MQFTFTIDLEAERKKLCNEWYNNDEMNEKHTLKRFLKLKATSKRIVSKYQSLIESIKPDETTINYKVLELDEMINPRLQVSFIKNDSIKHGLNDQEWIHECEQAYIKLNEWNASIQPWQKRKIIARNYDVALV